MRHSAATSAARQSAQAAARHGTRGVLPSTAEAAHEDATRAVATCSCSVRQAVVFCCKDVVLCCKDVVLWLQRWRAVFIRRWRRRRSSAPTGSTVKSSARTRTQARARLQQPSAVADAFGRHCCRWAIYARPREAAASVRRGSAALGHSLHRRYRMQRERDWQDALARDAHLYAIARQECAPISRSASSRLQHSGPARALAQCCTHRGTG
jgi:hypothetical protein